MSEQEKVLKQSLILLIDCCERFHGNYGFRSNGRSGDALYEKLYEFLDPVVPSEFKFEEYRDHLRKELSQVSA